MCDHHLWNDPDSLTCTATGPHDSHQYAATGGPASNKHEDDGGDS